MESLHIAVADKNQLVRLGLSGIISQLGDSFVLREIIDCERLKTFLQKEHYEIFIISQSFLELCSPEIVSSLKTIKKNQRIILLKDKAGTGWNIEFSETIEISDSEKTIFRKLENCILDIGKRKQPLRLSGDISEREKDVLKLVALGFTNKEIADRLFLSAHTVITHRKNITSKLGIKTIAGLTVYAVINKLITADELK